jgi:hypothetical protein
MRPCPPARTEFSLWKLLRNILFSSGKDLETNMAAHLGASQVIIADAWVKMLAEGLRSIAEGKEQKEIILPTYSCNEFTKAILLADLIPAYAPLDEYCSLSVQAIESVFNSNTLAVLSVNNTGVISDLFNIRKWCDSHGCLMIEDAGYTFPGADENGKTFGGFGHAAIINMSEGKTIPCGGAAWVINDPSLKTVFSGLAAEIQSQTPKSNPAEFLKLLIYRLGSSSTGYALYKFLKNTFGGDLKARFSSEPSRLSEDYDSGNLSMKNNQMMLDESHAMNLQRNPLRPWNRVRQSCALLILEQTTQIRTNRVLRLLWWKKYLGDSVVWLSLPADAMPVKQPFLLPQGRLTPAEITELAWSGIKKQYPVSWPMYQISKKHDKRFYEEVYTLPLHSGVSEASVRQLSVWLVQRIQLK